MKLLLENGADSKLPNKDGVTALDLAEKKYRQSNDWNNVFWKEVVDMIKAYDINDSDRFYLSLIAKI